MLFLSLMFLFSSLTFAAGGFEKPVLWSAQAAQRGGAYASSVRGADALLFNPAGLTGVDKKELHLGISAASGTSTSPVVSDQDQVKTFSGPVTPLGMMFAQRIDENQVVGIGLYALGGLDVAFNKVNLSSQGSEFNDYRPNVYGQLSVMELGLGYARKLDDNFSAGVSLRNHLANGGFSQLQISKAQGLGGLGIPDGTVLAISKGQFDDLKGSSFGSYMLGVNFLSDNKKTGLSLSYRSQVKFTLKTKAGGEIVYSNAGAAATGATAGEVNKFSGNHSEVSSSIPEAWTLSGFQKMTENNTFHYEYTWTEYSNNSELSINGKLTNPVDNSTTSVPDVALNWHDMHDFKFGWTNTAIESWIFGGGYSLTLPVTDRKTAGPTFAAPSNYHHFYAGLGKAFKNFRVDAAYEYYLGSGTGKTQASETSTSTTPSIGGFHETRAYAFFASLTYYL